MFTDGITNKLVACQLNDDDSGKGENIVLVRIYGNKTDLLIDRNAEIRWANYFIANILLNGSVKICKIKPILFSDNKMTIIHIYYIMLQKY